MQAAAAQVTLLLASFWLCTACAMRGIYTRGHHPCMQCQCTLLPIYNCRPFCLPHIRALRGLVFCLHTPDSSHGSMQNTRQPLACRPPGPASSACSTSGRHQRVFVGAPRHCRSRGLALSVQASVRARWCIDVRYGHKAEAVALMQEWVQVIGSRAGLTSANTRLSSGAVGAPESRVEVGLPEGVLRALVVFSQGASTGPREMQ